MLLERCGGESLSKPGEYAVRSASKLPGYGSEPTVTDQKDASGKRTYPNVARQEEQASKTPHFLAGFSFSAIRALTSFVTSAAGRGLSGMKWIVPPLTS